MIYHIHTFAYTFTCQRMDCENTHWLARKGAPSARLYQHRVHISNSRGNSTHAEDNWLSNLLGFSVNDPSSLLARIVWTVSIVAYPPNYATGSCSLSSNWPVALL